MGVSPSEKDALRHVHAGDTKQAAEVLVAGGYTAADLSTLYRGAVSALAVLRAATPADIESTPVEVDDLAKVLDLGMEGDPQRWSDAADSFTGAERAALRDLIAAFANATSAAAVMVSVREASTA